MATSDGFNPTTQAQFVTIELSKYKAAVAKALEREVKAMDQWEKQVFRWLEIHTQSKATLSIPDCSNTPTTL